MCDSECGKTCNQLEAEAINSNQQLLDFDIRSKEIKWQDFVVPLASRARPVYLQRQFGLISNYREPIGNHNRREVLLCHDMMGNYLEDKHYHSSKKFDDYRFYHWAGIDYFCYFSHQYITIPPCGWINAAHKHGVRVLGTFITESDSGSIRLHEVLQSKDTVDTTVAAMVRLCKHFGFEGWLLNVECNVNAAAMENLYYFVEHLRNAIETEVDHGIVFWYDSVIDTGELLWQNELNAKNVRFFRSADATFLNYAWQESSLEVTRSVCEMERAPSQRVFFGIDIFGRGQIGKFQSKQTLARIVSNRFSTAFFAPGWTYETLQQYGYNITLPLGVDDVNEAFLQRNDKFWWRLWDHLATHPYNQLAFYTDFCLGSGKNMFVCGLPKTLNTDETGHFYNLSLQSLQPTVPLYEQAEHCYNDAFNGGSCLRIVQYDTSFRLFATDFKFPRGGIVVAYAYKLLPRDGEFDCVLRFCTNNNARDCYLFLGDYYDTINLQKGRCYVSPFKPKYNELLSGVTECARIPKDMAFADFAANGWRTRYYVVCFDGPVQVKDIGVLYRRTAEAMDYAYLGAIYVNEFDVNASQDFPLDSNIALIQVYGNELLN